MYPYDPVTPKNNSSKTNPSIQKALHHPSNSINLKSNNSNDLSNILQQPPSAPSEGSSNYTIHRSNSFNSSASTINSTATGCSNLSGSLLETSVATSNRKHHKKLRAFLR